MRKLCIVIGMLWLCVTSCGDSYQSSIPSVTFNFSCSLSQSPYYKITTPGQFLKIEKNVNGLPEILLEEMYGWLMYRPGSVIGWRRIPR